MVSQGQPSKLQDQSSNIACYQVANIAGAGRGLVAVKSIKAGALVLREAPLLLTPSQDMHTFVCANCLRFARGAHPTQDPKLSQDLEGLGRISALLQLQPAEADDTEQIVAWIEQSQHNTPDTILPGVFKALAGVEGINAYGIMAPSGDEGERRVRGSGLYQTASLLNHDCMPNVARFDNFDAATGDNTLIEFRALHDIPAGEQLTQSYFPLTWRYEERQERCQEQYGFTCACVRCKVESAWSDEEDGGDSVASVHEQVACCKSETCQHASTEHEEGSSHKRQKLAATPDVSKVANEDSTSLNADCSATVQDVNKDEAGLVTQKESNESSVPIQSAGYAALLGANSPGKDGAVVNEVDAAYIMAFLDRHICPQETPAAGTQDVNVCGGTMAPHEADMDLYTCNMCGITRSETTRIAELEQAYLAVQTGTD